LFQNNKLSEAIDQFKEVDQNVPNYLDTHDYIFKSYHKLKEWEAMESFSKEVLANWPKDEISKKYLDIALNKKSVLTVLEEEVVKAPSPEKYLNLSLQYFNEGNYEDCIRVAGKALELNPEYADAHNNIGIGHFYLLNYDEAIEAYQKALKLNPSYQLAKNNLKNAQDKKKDLADVISNLSDREASAYYINLSLEFYKKEKYRTSIAAARKSIAIIPNAIAFNNICSSYNQLKEYQKAIAACNEALKLDPSSKLANGNLNYAKQHAQ
jgi:tetratricopeptide (TPR) repeat protein